MKGVLPVAYADAGTRVAALLVDFAVVFLVAGLLDGVTPSVAFAVVAFPYLAAFPLTRLAGTPGKWIFRVKLRMRSGAPVTPHAAALRAAAFLGWCALLVASIKSGLLREHAPGAHVAAWMIFALPWVAVGLTPRRQSAFDLLAGTLVVRANATAEAVAAAAPEPKRLRGASGVLALWALAGLVAFAGLAVIDDRDQRTRVAYALGETGPLRERIEAFYAKEKRWPDAKALGVEQWTAFPSGGGYALEAEGRIVIRFDTAPRLRGHRIIQRPVEAAGGKRLEWQCRAEPALHRYVPGSCRD